MQYSLNQTVQDNCTTSAGFQDAVHHNCHLFKFFLHEIISHVLPELECCVNCVCSVILLKTYQQLLFFVVSLYENFVDCMIMKINPKIKEMVTGDKLHQHAGYETHLEKKLFFFPGLILAERPR